jgi:hypothetical protein
MEISNNVIQFPSFIKAQDKIPTNEVISTGINNIKVNHINETLEILIPLVFNNIDLSGFDVIGEEYNTLNIKNGAMIIESIRSILCYHYGIHHPFQDLADGLFEQNEEGEFKIKQNLTLQIKENGV